MKSRPWVLGAIVVGAFGASWALKRSVSGLPPTPPSADVRRIVSLAPSTTETLFALGLGDRVVGVTEFCAHPPKVRDLPRMGGYYDPNYEAIVEARPDLILTLPEHEGVRRRLEQLGLPVLTVDHRNVEGILESFTTIAGRCGVDAGLRDRMEAEVAAVRSGVKDRPPRRVFVSVGRAMNEGSATRITTVGRNGYYDDLVRIAGGVNAYEGEIPFPAMSPEGVVALRPDVIVEVVPDLEERGGDAETLRAAWRGLPGLADVPVRVIAADYAIVPGPRFIHLLRDFARAIHE